MAHSPGRHLTINIHAPYKKEPEYVKQIPTKLKIERTIIK